MNVCYIPPPDNYASFHPQIELFQPCRAGLRRLILLSQKLDRCVAKHEETCIDRLALAIDSKLQSASS